MTQHMVLSLITPLLLLVAAPVTLALRTLPRGQGRRRGAARAAARTGCTAGSRRFVSHPLFTVPLFIASLYGVYFTPLFDALMSNPIGHQLMLAHFVVVGLLFFGPIVAQDPGRGRSATPAGCSSSSCPCRSTRSSASRS